MKKKLSFLVGSLLEEQKFRIKLKNRYFLVNKSLLALSLLMTERLA